MAKQVVHVVTLAPATVAIIREQNVRQAATILQMTEEMTVLIEQRDKLLHALSSQQSITQAIAKRRR